MKNTIQSVCVRVCLILACCASAAGQTATNHHEPANDHEPTYAQNPNNAHDAFDKVKSGNYTGIHVNMLAHFRVTESIPELEKQFALKKDDAHMRGIIASALVRLHDNDDTYWHYLVNMAIPAVMNDAPDYFIYDSNGKVKGGPSPELVAWAKAHDIPIEEASSDAVYGRGYEGIRLIAMTGDQRGIPLLRRALLAHNKVVEYVAAEGLAEAQDGASIPLIIDACNKAPRDAGSAIARSLVYFNDPTAQAVASKYLSAEEIKALDYNRTTGHKTPFDW